MSDTLPNVTRSHRHSQSGISMATTGRIHFGTSSLTVVLPWRFDRELLCPRLCDDPSRPAADWSTAVVVGVATVSASLIAWRALRMLLAS